MRYEGNGSVSKSNIGFESFLRGVNRFVCLRHYWCMKLYDNVWYMRRSRVDTIYGNV